MSSLIAMLDLKKFPKIGVRVPFSIRRKVKVYAAGVEGLPVGLQGDDVTMEGVFAAATLEFLALSDSAKLEVLKRRMPELLAMFEVEMPGAKENPGERSEVDDATEFSDPGELPERLPEKPKPAKRRPPRQA